MKLKSPIVIDGIEFVADVIQRFMDETEFKETVSEEYKRGFYDFGNAVVSAFKEMSKGGADAK